MDKIVELNNLTDRLDRERFADPSLGRYVRHLLETANRRKRRVAAFYRKAMAGKPDLQKAIDAYDPGWSQW